MNQPTRYRKKPVVIEAMCFDGTAKNASTIINWILNNNSTATYTCDSAAACHADRHVISIRTLEGTM